LTEAAREVEGAYSLVVLTEQSVIALRDPQGFRPLCLGRLSDGYVVASETCALDLVGAELIREIEPGEMVTVDPQGVRSRRALAAAAPPPHPPLARNSPSPPPTPPAAAPGPARRPRPHRPPPAPHPRPRA